MSTSLAYFIYAFLVYPPVKGSETFISEVGEGFGEIGLFALLFIYGSTVLKLVMGEGKLSRRLLPDYTPPTAASILIAYCAF